MLERRLDLSPLRFCADRENTKKIVFDQSVVKIYDDDDDLTKANSFGSRGHQMKNCRFSRRWFFIDSFFI